MLLLPQRLITGEGVQLSKPSPTFGLLSYCLLPGTSGGWLVVLEFWGIFFFSTKHTHTKKPFEVCFVLLVFISLLPHPHPSRNQTWIAILQSITNYLAFSTWWKTDILDVLNKAWRSPPPSDWFSVFVSAVNLECCHSHWLLVVNIARLAFITTKVKSLHLFLFLQFRMFIVSNLL